MKCLSQPWLNKRSSAHTSVRFKDLGYTELISDSHRLLWFRERVNGLNKGNHAFNYYNYPPWETIPEVSQLRFKVVSLWWGSVFWPHFFLLHEAANFSEADWNADLCDLGSLAGGRGGRLYPLFSMGGFFTTGSVLMLIGLSFIPPDISWGFGSFLLVWGWMGWSLILVVPELMTIGGVVPISSLCSCSPWGVSESIHISSSSSDNNSTVWPPLLLGSSSVCCVSASGDWIFTSTSSDSPYCSPGPGPVPVQVHQLLHCWAELRVNLF